MAWQYEFSWLVILAGLAGGCGTQQMHVPAEISTRSEVLVVTDRSSWSGSLVDESFKLGTYAVKDVDRDWDSSSGFTFGGLSQGTTEGGYAYKLDGKGATEAGHCATEKRDTGISLGGGFALEFQFSKLGCSCDGSHKQASVVVESKQNEFAGVLTTSQATYQVKSVHELENGSKQEKPTGYRMDGQSAVGAAEVTHPGRVWLDKRLSEGERAEVACLFAGLMLYKPKEDK